MNAVYTRQSLDVKDSLSIESQLDACLNENGSAEYRHYNDAPDIIGLKQNPIIRASL